MNGGTVLAVAGPTYCVLAGDTRLSSGFNIHSRSVSKLHLLSSDGKSPVAIASAGMQADAAALHKQLDARTTMYAHANSAPPSALATAQMLSIILYQRRFFPYYTWNLVCGLDDAGRGAVYAYDPVGNYERVPVSCSGSAEPLIQPLLDNMLAVHGGTDKSVLEPAWVNVPEERVVDWVKDAFTSAGERDIYTGDGVDIWVINAQGMRKEHLRLKED
jgi:20S proteasome subunit beta 6